MAARLKSSSLEPDCILCVTECHQLVPSLAPGILSKEHSTHSAAMDAYFLLKLPPSKLCLAENEYIWGLQQLTCPSTIGQLKKRDTSAGSSDMKNGNSSGNKKVTEHHYSPSHVKRFLLMFSSTVACEENR